MRNVERLSYCFKINRIINVLATYQKGIYYSGIKVFHNLPSHIKNLSDNNKQFKSVISGFHRDADEICTLLGYYAASWGNCLP
jgi:hypothetical protein